MYGSKEDIIMMEERGTVFGTGIVNSTTKAPPIAGFSYTLSCIGKNRVEQRKKTKKNT